MTQNVISSSGVEFPSMEIEKLRDGDVEAFEKLFRRFFYPLVAFACHYLDEPKAAEDLVQDVFVQVWSHREQLDPGRNIKTYLYTAVRNRAFKYARHLRGREHYRIHHIASAAAGDSPEQQVMSAEFHQAFEKSIQTLPVKCRTIFCMNRFDDLKYREIAEILDISIKTVETQMSRALKLLKKQLHSFLLLFSFL